MAQYTYSFIRSEYYRIPIELEKNLKKALDESKADEETKKLVEEVCKSVTQAVADICTYSQDQLQLW